MISSRFSLLSLQNLNFSLSLLFCSFRLNHNLKCIHNRFYGIIYILLIQYFINPLMEKFNLLLWAVPFCPFYFLQRFVSFMEVLHRRVYFLYGYTMQHRIHRLFHNLTQCIRIPFGFISFFDDVFYWGTLIIFFMCSLFIVKIISKMKSKMFVL